VPILYELGEFTKLCIYRSLGVGGRLIMFAVAELLFGFSAGFRFARIAGAWVKRAEVASVTQAVGFLSDRTKTAILAL